MFEVAEVRQRVQRLIAQSRTEATNRRARTAAMEREGERVLTQVVAPMFKMVAAALKAEGFLFRVSTPVGAVRMAAETAGENFIELVLDTRDDPPALRGCASRLRGRRLVVEDRVVCQESAIGALTDSEVLEFLLGELGPFLER